MSTRVFLDTLGCKLNQAESESIARQLGGAGYCPVTGLEEADVYILNTCSVTATADAKSRHLLRQARRRNPRALVVATGCYAQREPDKLARIPGVSLVIGNQQKDLLPFILKDHGCRPGATAGENAHPPSFRTRSFIKIQDGCKGACAYCVVPGVRKGQNSVPAEEVVTEIRHRSADGFKEVVLTGTNVGSYADSGEGLIHLLETVLAGTSIPRLRLSSLQPQEISSDLISLWKDERLCPHFHLSLQSGCDDTLHRMKRRYSVDDYVKSVSLIRDMVPDAAINTDIIVGFPGETDAEFEESYRVCKEMEFARIHVFPYSARPGTEAAALPEKIDGRTTRERSRKMLSLAGQSARAFRERFRGTTRRVLWEKRDENGLWTGLTDNYIQVQLASRDDLANQVFAAAVE